MSCCTSNGATSPSHLSKSSRSRRCGFIHGYGCFARASASHASRSSTAASSRCSAIVTSTCAVSSISPVTISRRTFRRPAQGCCVPASCARASMPSFRRLVCREDSSLFVTLALMMAVGATTYIAAAALPMRSPAIVDRASAGRLTRLPWRRPLARPRSAQTGSGDRAKPDHHAVYERQASRCPRVHRPRNEHRVHGLRSEASTKGDPSRSNATADAGASCSTGCSHRTD